MKITVERDVLTRALATASRFLPAKPTIPILGNLLLEVEGSKLSISGTNMDMKTTAVVACHVEGPDIPSITVLGRLLSDTVAGMPKGSQVELEWTDERTVTVRAGRSRYRLFALPSDQFPAFIEPAEPAEFEISASAFCTAIAATEFAITHDKGRIYLNGVHMHIADPEGHSGFGGLKGDHLAFVATDGREFGWVATSVPEGAEDMVPVIIPEFAVKEMARIAGDAEDGASIRLIVDRQRVALLSGSISFSTKLIDATYAIYNRAVPKTGYRELIADVADLTSALSRLVMIGDSTRAQMRVQNGTMFLSLSSSDNGDAEEQIQVQWEHDDLQKKINARGFLRVLANIKTELCCIRINEPKRPVLFNDYVGGKMIPDRLFLSMPMELD